MQVKNSLYHRDLKVQVLGKGLINDHKYVFYLEENSSGL